MEIFRSSHRAAAGRDGFAIPLTVGLLLLIVMVAFSGYFQVSSYRQMLELLYARRLRMAAANSAFEEASAALEGRNRSIPPPRGDLIRDWSRIRDQRNSRALVTIPVQIAPVLARGLLAGQRVTLGDVRLSSSDWVVNVGSAGPNADPSSVKIHEVGILHLEVDVTVRAGSSTVRGVVSCRRHMGFTPDQAGTGLVLQVSPVNMVVRVAEN